MQDFPPLSSWHAGVHATFFAGLKSRHADYSHGFGIFPGFLSRYWLGIVYVRVVMAITTKRTRFSRRLPDHVTDELVNVLSERKQFGFNDLFERVFANLKLRNAVSGGEEMLRLRAYEKLQNLVTRGLVEKNGKEYKGTSRVREASSSFAVAQDAQD